MSSPWLERDPGDYPGARRSQNPGTLKRSLSTRQCPGDLSKKKNPEVEPRENFFTHTDY